VVQQAVNFSVKPESDSRHLNTGHRMDHRQAPSMLILGKNPAPRLMSAMLSMRHQWFICIRLSDSHMTGSIPPFTVSFTTSPLPVQQHTSV
jgi:hypothetical protein